MYELHVLGVCGSGRPDRFDCLHAGNESTIVYYGSGTHSTIYKAIQYLYYPNVPAISVTGKRRIVYYLLPLRRCVCQSEKVETIVKSGVATIPESSQCPWCGKMWCQVDKRAT